MWSMIVLGSGQDGGLPQFGAWDGLDAAARSGDLQHRYSSSMAVVGDDGRVLLFDAGPDLKHHEAVLRAHPAVVDKRGPLIDGIVLTHAHVGHYAGLIHFGREVSAASGVPCWVTPSMGSFLSSHAPWSLTVSHGHIELRITDPGSSFRPWSDLEVTLVPVPHRHELSDTVAISVEGTGLYLPDLDDWDSWPDAATVLAEHSVAFLDATFWSADELPGRDIAEIRHPLVPDTLTRWAELAVGRRVVLTHLNHSNPVCDPGSKEHAAVLAAGFEVASEGLTLRL
jgi:pyrroloquinoline quinone biosynthesis protein B